METTLGSAIKTGQDRASGEKSKVEKADCVGEISGKREIKDLGIFD